MRYLLVSDIHGNWDALEAVLRAAHGNYDKILCCGDLVGYGPDPNRIVQWARQSVASQIRGNHDRVCCGLPGLLEFTPLAEAAAIWTLQTLAQDHIEWLRELPSGPLGVDGFSLVHGSPFDEDEYVITLAEANAQRVWLRQPLTFFGHTHIQGGFVWHDGKIRALGAPLPNRDSAVVTLHGDSIYLINPGSVGQPRDSDPRAAWALYDSDRQAVELRRTEYDFGAVARKITAAGLPPVLGHRLSLGK